MHFVLKFTKKVCFCYNWTGLLSELQDAVCRLQESSSSMYKMWQHCVAT